MRVYRVAIAGNSAASAALALPDTPSFAVLPFQNLSGNYEQEYFADGMVEEIITAISRRAAAVALRHRAQFELSPDLRR